MFSFAQTSNENITIKKRNGSIVNVETNEKLSKLELKSMLDEESYDSYIKGRNRYIASIPFWVGTAVEGAGSITSFAIANSLKNDCTTITTIKTGMMNIVELGKVQCFIGQWADFALLGP